MPRLILHVDDDPQLPEGLAAVLEADGYQWLRTADPEQVMRLVEQEAPALVLMEIDLPGCDGLDLLGGIVAAREGVPVLILTRQPRDSTMHGEAIALGVTQFLSKPVLRAQLLKAIRESALPPPKSETSATTGEAPAAPRPDLSGEIADTPVPELLARLRRRGSGGVLTLRRGRTQVDVELRNGTPICVSSDYGDGPAASASEDDAEEEIFDSFAWADGAWQFFAGRRLAPEVASELSRDPAGLLLCGVLQSSPLEHVRERLRKRATLYVSVRDAEEFLEDIELSARQATVLGEMTGQESLGDLLASQEFEERMLYGLWVCGRIELHAVPTLDLSDLSGEESAPQLRVEPAREKQPEREREPLRRPPRSIERLPPARPARPTPARVSRPEIAREPEVQELSRDALSQSLREFAKQVMASDDFAVLGVDVEASEERIEQAYRRRLADVPAQALNGSDLGLRVRAERIRDRIEAAYAHLKDPESRRAYALLRNEESQDRAAGNAAERALEGERWFRKGRGQLEQKRYAEAAEAFGMASHLDPNEGEYMSHLGYALFLSKPDEKVVQREAMEHVANGIKRSPTREISYIYLGRILKARGEEDAALKIFRRALRIKPDSHPALQEIRLLEMRRRKGKSKGLLSRLLGS